MVEQIIPSINEIEFTTAGIADSSPNSLLKTIQILGADGTIHNNRIVLTNIGIGNKNRIKQVNTIKPLIRIPTIFKTVFNSS